ncbi:retrovirus-related pol polyprotein from transposon tnt 1-94 [Phytophthora cinnamomi]|uniref:retrovirus-related pol polyprotein from transposon tnt 1-94 n=1 Tax=Phytophthora cinnamomi TaxID=4785 RepID=UPI0035599DA9|nr:retrovirus-related pol polyprotein from transposon tnt 1-94 [Phytophthora cinnamomi]
MCENAERQRPQRANVAQSEDDSGDFLFSVGGGSNTTKSNEVWLVDSGATQHMTSSKKFMRNPQEDPPVDVHLADDVSRNLFSVGRFTKDVGPVTFESDGASRRRRVSEWKLGAREGKELFKLSMIPVMPDEANVASSKDRKGDTTSYLWHLRLGHIGHGMAKSTFGGKRYFVTFIDDKSHFCVVYLMRNKSEVAAKFAEFVALAETQTGKRVKTLRSDNGGEYTSREMAKFCSDRGIVQKFTPPYTPQLNGVAGMNRTLVECARCMLEHAGLSKSYWGEAVVTATFLWNRCPTRAISHKSPHQVWTGKKPLLANLKVFGCHAYVLVPKAKRSSLTPGRMDVRRWMRCLRRPKSQDFEAAYVVDSVGEMPTTFSRRWNPATQPSGRKHATRYDSLLKNKTWKCVPLPKGRKAIGNRWVFRVKENQAERSNGSRRVWWQGFSQKYGIDYDRPSLQWPSSRRSGPC